VAVPDEDMLHLVTGLSGSGPAYVFAMVEAMAQAASDLGLPEELAVALAHQTVAGAGAMVAQPESQAEALRHAVTSKGGTTAAGLAALVPELNLLMGETIQAASKRSVELSQ
jgi:pyrroline-5-carboxylate reductase